MTPAAQQRMIFFTLPIACTVALIFTTTLTVRPPASSAQQPAPQAPATLSQDLQRTGAEAAALSLSLPNFTCGETVNSQTIREGKVVHNVHLTGKLRMVRKPDGKLEESYVFNRNFFAMVLPLNIPLYVSGGFDSALSYFSPLAQACYNYTLSGDRIDFASRTDPISAHACAERGLKGFALLAPNGRVTHIERTIPAEVAAPLKLATFAAIDLAPVEMNGHTYNLSDHMIAEMPLKNATGRVEATYTDCHLFTATITMGPATEVSPATTPPPQ